MILNHMEERWHFWEEMLLLHEVIRSITMGNKPFLFLLVNCFAVAGFDGAVLAKCPYVLEYTAEQIFMCVFSASCGS